MWKKFLIVLISLVGTFSVVFAMNRDFSAQAIATLKVGDTFNYGTAWHWVKDDAGNFINQVQKPVEWFVLDIKDNEAILIQSGDLLTYVPWNAGCNSSKSCMNFGYQQNMGELYEFMNGSGTPVIDEGYGYGDGATPFVEDYVKSLADVNRITVGSDTYSIDGKCYSDPYILSDSEFLAMPESSFKLLQTVTQDIYSWWLATPATFNLAYAVATNADSKSKMLLKQAAAIDYVVRPAMKLDLTKLTKMKVLEFWYTATPQNDVSTYEYAKNVGMSTKIGEVEYVIAAGTPSFEIVAHPTAPSGHENDYLNFDIYANPSTSPVDVTIKNDGPNIVNRSLKAGDYYFRITGIDQDGKPDPAPYQDVVLKVEKTAATITFDDESAKEMKIGDEGFTDSITTSNTDTLKSDDLSYIISGSPSDVLTITKNSDLMKYDVSVPKTYTKTGLPADYTLSAKIKETDNFLEATTTVNRAFNVSKKIGEFTFTAKESSFTPDKVKNANTTIATVNVSDGIGPFQYELVSASDDNYNANTAADNDLFQISATPAILGKGVDVKNKVALTEERVYHLQLKVIDTITSETKYTTGIINVGLSPQSPILFKDSAGGNEIHSKNVRHNNTASTLFAEGGDSGVAIEYTALPQDQQPSNIDPSTIATIDKGSGKITPVHVGTIKVMAKRPGNSTYADVEVIMELTIEPVQQLLSFQNTTNPIKIAIDETLLVDAKATIKDGGAEGVGAITYKLSDTSLASIDELGNVTGSKAGNVTLTATLNDKTGVDYNPDYEEVIESKTIQVYKKMALLWTDGVPLLQANANAIGDKAGTISVKDNAGTPTYAIASKTSEKNADAAFFSVLGSGVTADLKLAKKISASDYASHGGTFKVQVDVTDQNSTETIDIVVQIEEAENELYFTEDGVKVTTLTKQFKENGNTFTLSSYSSNAGGVTYDVATSDTSGTLSVSGTGVVTINKAGTGIVSAVIASSEGYAGGTITMNVVVNPGEQSVTFKDTATIKRPFIVDSTFHEMAELKETSKLVASTRTITYTSNRPSVCDINEDGEVTMLTKGTCDISASNQDVDWKETTVNKQIVLYDKMSVSYTPLTPNIKAETNVIGDKVGTLQVSEHQTPPTYKISTNSTTQNADASFFQVIGNGASADLKLAKKISALDWVSHSGIFKVQVDVSDVNGTETIDVTVQIDPADNTASFTENGKNITSLTKKFGENENHFSVTSTSSNAGAVTYGIDTSDTSDTLTTTTSGDVTIQKAGKGKVTAEIAAGGGYASKTIIMEVTIELGDQTIAFKDSETLNRPFIVNTTFSEAGELKETSAEKLSSRTITYTSNSPAVCDIDTQGTVTMKTKGNCDITISNKDENWTEVSENKVINLYDGMGVSFTQTPSLQAETTNTGAGAKAGSLTVNGGIDPKTYAIATVTGAKNKDASLFQVNSSGIVSFKKAIMASDLVGKYNTTKKVYELYVQIETTDSLHTKVTTDALVEIKGAPLKATFDTNGTGKITKVYGLNKTFPLDLSSNKGGGTPTYQLKGDASMPSDVLQSVDPSGLVTILHANDKAFVGNPLKVEAVIPPSNGYDGETIEVQVEITPAPQPDFAFVTPNIKLGHEAILTPTFTGNLSSGEILMTSGNNALASISGKDIKAKKTDGTVTITAVESGDRDYQSAVATATVTIDSAPTYSLIVSVPSATYGDTNLKATANAIGSIGTNPSLAWSSSDANIADIDASGNITIKKAGTVTITCTRATTGEPSVTATAILVVDPKPISVTIDNAEKYVGEAVPSFQANIPTEDLVGSDTIDQPLFSCKDGSTLVDANTKAGTYDISGTYPTGSYSNYDITVSKGILTIKQDASLASWFHLEGAESKNTLQADEWHKEDVNVVLDSAVDSARTYDEISLDKTLWDSTMIPVTTEGEHKKDVFFRISASGKVSTSQLATIKIDKTKPVIKSITGTETNKDSLSRLLNKLTLDAFFKPGTKVSMIGEDIQPSTTTTVSGVKDITYSVYEIDKITGKMNTTALDSGTMTPDASGKIEITLDDVGLYRVCALSKDNAGNEGSEKCSDIKIKQLDVDIDNDGEDEYQDPDEDGCPDINIPLQDEKGDIYKINIDRDGDGIPDLDIDSDGDGIAEINVDSDEDKKPDLNLIKLTKWTPTFCVPEKLNHEGEAIQYCTMKDIKPVINISTNKNKVADLNIDIDGDMEAEINIDRNEDGKLDKRDLNITGQMKTWVPDKDFEYLDFVYDTQIDLKARINVKTTDEMKPDLNIDLTGDGLPDLNIDANGDGLPETNIDYNGDGVSDFNLDPDRTGTPQSNFINVTVWKPDLNGEYNGIEYLTMKDLTLNDTLIDGDSGIQIQKPGGSFLPNYSIKVSDVKDTINQEEKRKFDEFIDENTEIKDIYDVQLSDGTSVIQPDGSIKVRIPLRNGLKNTDTIKVIVQGVDGIYKEVSATIVDGFIEYETDYLGKVGIIADKISDSSFDPEQPNVDNSNANSGAIGGSTPDANVKGEYVGGAKTGDEHTSSVWLMIFVTTAGVMIHGIIRKRFEH